ncbi:MAG TPA: hypothetical protein PLN61_04455 [bacterium]|nr:hypothetical protein [bacterium]HQI47895.1 hypothetical protein [bacterium]HQJ66341.1 hypothetical protein [bacterium]
MVNLLNDAQRTSLTVTLRIIEKQLLTMQMLIREGTIKGSLYRLQADFPPDTLTSLSGHIGRILISIRNLTERFGLDGKADTYSAMIQASRAYFQILLADVKSDKLRRYGEVAPLLEAELDPLINKLVEEIELLNLTEERIMDHE